MKAQDSEERLKRGRKSRSLSECMLWLESGKKFGEVQEKAVEEKRRASGKRGKQEAEEVEEPAPTARLAGVRLPALLPNCTSGSPIATHCHSSGGGDPTLEPALSSFPGEHSVYVCPRVCSRVCVCVAYLRV